MMTYVFTLDDRFLIQISHIILFVLKNIFRKKKNKITSDKISIFNSHGPRLQKNYSSPKLGVLDVIIPPKVECTDC